MVALDGAIKTVVLYLYQYHYYFLWWIKCLFSFAGYISGILLDWSHKYLLVVDEKIDDIIDLCQ